MANYNHVDIGKARAGYRYLIALRYQPKKHITQQQVVLKLLQSNYTCIWSLLYPDLEKKEYLYGLSHSQSPQTFDLMRHVIVPLVQQLQPIQSVVKSSTVYLS